MIKSEFLELIKDVKDDEELKFYVWDCEYDKEGFELGKGKIMSYDGYVNVSVN